MVFVDRDIFASVLFGYFLSPRIEQIEFGFHFGNVRVGSAFLFSHDFIELHEKFMNLIVHFHFLSNLTYWNLVPKFEFLNLLNCVHGLLRLPSCLLVT